MLTTTMDAVKAMLKADPSLSVEDRVRVVGALKNIGREPAATATPAVREARVMTRREVAGRFNRSLRFVDKLATQGVLHRITLPGRVRACGYRASEVERVIAGVAEV